MLVSQDTFAGSILRFYVRSEVAYQRIAGNAIAAGVGCFANKIAGQNSCPGLHNSKQ